MKEKIIRTIHIVSACIPLLLMGLLITHRILTGGGITAEELLAYTPESPIMAALVMILFFLCKSLSIFFPVTVLCIASGLLFPLPAALLVVTIGLGLGTVVMGVFDRKGLEAYLQIPEDQELMALIALGYPDESPAAPRRKETSLLLSYR